MKINIYTDNGTQKGTLTVPAIISEAKINQDLMNRAVKMRLHNARNPIAHTLTRGEVKATTKKLFRQKGTGNARRGSRVTNLLRGGGVTHGPRNTVTFNIQMPKKERRAALFSSLRVKLDDKSIFSLEKWTNKAPKTSKMTDFLKKTPVGKRYLLVISEKDVNLEKSASNIPGVKTILASYLNPYDVINADQICFVQDALDVFTSTFTTKK
jgi:large subunit ribosomal protein L4